LRCHASRACAADMDNDNNVIAADLGRPRVATVEAEISVIRLATHLLQLRFISKWIGHAIFRF
jgi:hypothetical protein